MKNLKIKIIVGYRKDQSYTIDADEAHKAYYLFLHPEERGIFNNGVAIIGKNITGIEPDYNATMGWNPSYTPEGVDWTEIREKKIDNKIRDVLYIAKQVAQDEPKEKMSLPLSEIRPLLE